ncbi:MAG TPA: phosphoadenylyl-sulfate reductase [Candidatus Dormibacteraeota bacterium]|nr:phosphoadenylyl-sulfate reductase [Candidatus Dormibacteraeota bacterium]
MLSRTTPAIAPDAPAEEILGWALREFPRDRIALCTSFQLEGMVILDMAWRIDPLVRVFTIDTGRLPAETLALIDQVRDRYRIRIEVLHPEARELSAFTSEHGVNPFYRSVDLRLACCDVRKVRPLTARLSTVDAWITGLRRSQSASRAATPAITTDQAHRGILKINPLAAWSLEQVEAYTLTHDLPRNALYAKGYTSIGCAPCTRATAPGEDIRAGRWWWERGDKECGIHVTPEG